MLLLTEVSTSSGRKRRFGGGSARAIMSGFFSSSLTLLFLVLVSERFNRKASVALGGGLHRLG